MSHGKHGVFTVRQHIIESQPAHATATGEFSWLLSGITLAGKIIASQMRRPSTSARRWIIRLKG